MQNEKEKEQREEARWCKREPSDEILSMLVSQYATKIARRDTDTNLRLSLQLLFEDKAWIQADPLQYLGMHRSSQLFNRN